MRDTASGSVKLHKLNAVFFISFVEKNRKKLLTNRPVCGIIYKASEIRRYLNVTH
jgi:hypothetical protein